MSSQKKTREEIVDMMYQEGVERLRKIGVATIDQWNFFVDKKIAKSYVDHKNCFVRKSSFTDEEFEMVKEFVKRTGHICYYLIEDEGMWPDGGIFHRYTILYVDENEQEYDMVKEECIGRCGTIPAYVVNMEEPDCSELTEFSYEVVDGLLINLS